MRLKRHLMAAAVGGAAVWFTHPTDGERRRHAAAVLLGRARESMDQVVEQQVQRRRRPGPTPSAATLIDVVEAARRDGAAAEFTVAPDTRLHCGSCDNDVDPSAVEREWMHRLEGASDPDELVSVSMITCPACAARGLLVLPYGPAADELESDIARHLPNPVRADMAPLAV